MAVEYTEDFDLFLQDTLAELPGVIRSVAKRELRLTLREFFEKSYAWTVQISDIAIPQGINSVVQIDDGDANTEVVAVLYVGINQEDGTGNVQALTPMPFGIEEAETATDPLFWFSTSQPDEIAVYPYPSLDLSPKTLKVVAAVMPAESTEALPRQVRLKFYDAIRDGFLARLYSHPAKPYTNERMAMAKRHNFLRAIGYYAAQRKKGYNNSPNWAFPGGWGINSARRRTR